MLQLNVKNLGNVTPGMSIEEVEKTMGTYTTAVRDGELANPWKKQNLDGMIVYHYLTSVHPPFTAILERQATPVVFSGGKVVGIGREYLRKIYEKQDVPPAQEGPATEASVEQRLKRLKALLDSGQIDSAAYKAQQKRILETL
jgi:hypothetical protein